MKARKVLLSICAVIAVTVGVWAATQSSAPTASASQIPNWQRVDLAARNLNGGDEASVRTLVSAVFADNGISETVIATSGSVPDRLVAAEIAYQKGQTKGISEENVVGAVNQLAQRFNAPAYAHTDVKELRRLRLRMLTVYPGFIGRGAAATRDDSKPHFQRTMSPVEAFHVASTLVFQKLSNPSFQFSRSELDNASKADHSGNSDLTRRVANGERTQEMLGVIRQGSSSMSLRDMLDLGEQTLDRLGIPR